MSLLQIYWRALGYLAADRKRVALICGANVALAIIAILEPIMFGRVIDAISEKARCSRRWPCGPASAPSTSSPSCWWRAAPTALPISARSEVLCQSFERVITMPLAWHHQRGTSNALHTLLRAVETLFSLWLEFMRQHLSTAVALVLLVPTALSMDLRMSLVLLALGVALCRHRPAGDAAAPRQARQPSSATTTRCSRM